LDETISCERIGETGSFWGGSGLKDLGD